MVDNKIVACDCGDYSIKVSDLMPVYQFKAICPDCGDHFGYDVSEAVPDE